MIAALDRDSAERLDKRIRLLVGTIHDQIDKLYELVAEAKQGDVHAALGFPSWTAYLADVFTFDIRLEREQRRELVGYLAGEGMSQRVIADVVGVSVGTVNADLSGAQNRTPVVGRDGKTYAPRTELLSAVEARELTDRIRGHLRELGEIGASEGVDIELDLAEEAVRAGVFQIMVYPAVPRRRRRV